MTKQSIYCRDVRECVSSLKTQRDGDVVYVLTGQTTSMKFLHGLVAQASFRGLHLPSRRISSALVDILWAHQVMAFEIQSTQDRSGCFISFGINSLENYIDGFYFEHGVRHGSTSVKLHLATIRTRNMWDRMGIEDGITYTKDAEIALDNAIDPSVLDIHQALRQAGLRAAQEMQEGM